METLTTGICVPYMETTNQIVLSYMIQFSFSEKDFVLKEGHYSSCQTFFSPKEYMLLCVGFVSPKGRKH